LECVVVTFRKIEGSSHTQTPHLTRDSNVILYYMLKVKLASKISTVYDIKQNEYQVIKDLL